MKIYKGLLLGIICIFTYQFSFAQNYPDRAIRIVVPFSGGAVDVMARLMANKMAESLKQAVIVENRPGAGGNIGAEIVAKSNPDGYTILLDTMGLAIRPALHKKMPFDVNKDFIPVTQLVSVPLILVASNSAPISNVQSLLKYAKEKPGVINYGHAGIGGTLQLAVELFANMGNVKFTGVPYKGDAQITTALLSKEIDIAILPVSTVIQYINTGNLKVIGITSSKRLASLPEIPTISESGLSDYESSSWYSLFVPAKTPDYIVKIIHQEAIRALNTPDTKDKIYAMHQELIGSSQAGFEKKFKSDIEKVSKLIKESGIPIQE
jgi:hypothetical protein